MNEDDLNTIIKNCLEGERESQKKIFDLFAPKMMTVCLRYTRSHADAEDVLQDGFVNVYTKMNQFKFKGSFEGWIRRIMVNCALRFLEKRKDYVPLNDDRVGLETNVEQASVEEDVDDKARRILSLVRTLPEGYKKVFNMYVFEGFDHNEIAEVMNITSSTSRSQLTKARKYLRKEMENNNLL